MELSIGDEKRSLPLCAKVAGFGKSGLIYQDDQALVLTVMTMCLYGSLCSAIVMLSLYLKISIL